jgi:hypothetical protein
MEENVCIKKNLFVCARMMVHHEVAVACAHEHYMRVFSQGLQNRFIDGNNILIT